MPPVEEGYHRLDQTEIDELVKEKELIEQETPFEDDPLGPISFPMKRSAKDGERIFADANDENAIAAEEQKLFFIQLPNKLPEVRKKYLKNVDNVKKEADEDVKIKEVFDEGNSKNDVSEIKASNSVSPIENPASPIFNESVESGCMTSQIQQMFAQEVQDKLDNLHNKMGDRLGADILKEDQYRLTFCQP